MLWDGAGMGSEGCGTPRHGHWGNSGTTYEWVLVGLQARWAQRKCMGPLGHFEFEMQAALRQETL